jgi:uncharacterized RDD family membrane protein YckC
LRSLTELQPYPEEAAEREASEHPPGHGANYASWGRRAVGLLLDTLIVFVVIFAGALVIAALSAAAGTDALFVLAVILIIGFPIFYYTYFVGNEQGQTYGRRALGIQVRSADTGGQVGYGRAFGRYLVTYLFGIFVLPLLVDYLWPLWDSRNQTLHDKAASTIVIRL